MKIIMIGLCGVGLCAAVAAGLWLGTDAPVNDGASAVPSANSERAASATPSGMWSWGVAGANKTDPGKSLNELLAQALRPAGRSAEGDDARDKLRKLAKEDPVVMQQLMQSYDKESNAQTRQLIVSLLSNIEKPEILAFSKRLAASGDITQRKDGLSMLQNLGSDSPEVRPIILQTLARETSPEVIMMALAALRPPAEGNTATMPDAKDAAAVVAQLRELTRNADPKIRIQSLIQLGQWDKADSSQDQWTQALADQSPQVRQVAVTAIAQSGTRSDTVKAALIGLANNQSESKDVRGSALQVLERFTLSKDEAANYSQLRSQILGL
jgi:hypothetical protein